MLMDMLERHKEKFVLADSSLLRELEPDDALMERLSRIGVLSDV